MKIGIDLDEVVAKLMDKWLVHYNKDYKDNIHINNITDWNISRFVKLECGDMIYKYLSLPNFFSDLEVIEDSQRIIGMLAYLHKVFFVSDASFGHAYKDKIEWVEEHFPFVEDVVFTKSKGLINADMLIDDAIHNLTDFKLANPKSEIIVMDRPWNKGYNGIRRVYNWLDLEKYFKMKNII